MATRPVPGVDAQDQPAGKLPAHAAEPSGSLEGQRADHQAAEPQVQQLADGRLAADAAAQLAGTRRPPRRSADRGQVARLPLAGPVQIDQVEVLGPQAHPMPGHGGRVVAENRFPADNPPAGGERISPPQVDRRPDFHPFRAPARATAHRRNRSFYTEAADASGRTRSRHMSPRELEHHCRVRCHFGRGAE